MVLKTSEVADRIRAHIDERRREDRKYSRRALSAAAGLNPNQLTMILRRLDDGADIDTGILVSIAKAMGRSHHWLLHGEEPRTPGVRIRDIKDWAEVAAQARAKYPKLSVQSMERVGDVTVPTAPATLEVSSLIALAVALDLFVGES